MNDDNRPPTLPPVLPLASGAPESSIGNGVVSTPATDCQNGSCYLGPVAGGLRPLDYDDDGDIFASVMGATAAQAAPQNKITFPPAKEVVPQTIYLSERCLELGWLMGPLAYEMDKRKLEVGGFYLINKGDPNFSAVDFIVPKNLPVTEGNIYIAEHYPQAGDEVRDRNQANGTNHRMGYMFHVHPFGGPGQGLYHSPADDNVLVSLVNKMAKTTRITSSVPYQLIQGMITRERGEEATILRGDELSDVVLKFVYPNDEAFFALLKEFGLTPDPNDFKKKEMLARLLEQIEVQPEEPRTICFAISMVYNNHRDIPYVKMGIEEKFILSGKKEYTTVDRIPIEIINRGVNIPTEDEVRALIKERIKFPPTFVQQAVGAVTGAATAWKDRRSGKGKGKGTTTVQGGYTTSTTYTTGTSYGTPVYVTKKKKGYDETEIARVFALSAYSYMAQYQQSRCRYSEYMGDLLDRLNSPTVGKYETSGHRVYRSVGLREAVLELGKLPKDAEDDPKATRTPLFQTYKIGDIARILDNMLGISKDTDQLELQFMLKFIGSNLEQKNKVIEDFILSVIEEEEKRMLADPKAVTTAPSTASAPPRDDGDLFESVLGGQVPAVGSNDPDNVLNDRSDDPATD
ncbi:MAG: hypothetical protein WCV90_01195 [Candidatus Woesearchaeota archaeon]